MITPTILAGVEGDWSWGSGSDSLSGANSFVLLDGIILGTTFHSELQLTWQATIRGRLGYVSGPWLFYGTGGAAFTQAQWSDRSTIIGGPGFTSSTDASKTLSGWTVGGGVEYMLYASNWIARVEYLYENFGNFSVPVGFGPQMGTLELKAVNKVRVAISYKFGP